jgi:hypothetical protein
VRSVPCRRTERVSALHHRGALGPDTVTVTLAVRLGFAAIIGISKAY